MVKKINHFVDLERKETGVTESAAEENKSDSGSSETDNKECISECKSIEVAGSTPEDEVTTVQSSISKDEPTKVVENVFESKEIEAVESSLFKCEESPGKDLQVKSDESRSVTKKKVDSAISDDVAGFHIPEHPHDGNIPSTSMKSLDELPQPPVLPLGQAEELPVTQVIDEAGSNTDIQEQDPGNINTTEQQGPVIGVSEIRVKKVDDTNGSQNTDCMNSALLEPPFIFRDAEEVPVAQVKETAKGCSDSERNECQVTEEGDEDGSSQETYCSESSFQRTECTAHKHVHIILEPESECHELSEGTGSLGGVSQATTVAIADTEGGASQASTVDIADTEAMPCSETDIFASQSEEDAEVSGVSSGTVPDYSDFVKGSHDRSKQLMQSSTALSMDGTQVSSSTPQTSCTESVRKHKQDELVLSHPQSKLRRFADDDKGEDFNVEERSSLGVDILPPSPVHSHSNDDVASCKAILQAVSPTRVTLKEKEVVFGQKTNGQQQSFLASPKTNRKLNFETRTERVKTQLVHSSSGSEGNAEKVEFKTDQYREEGGQDDVSSVQHSNDYSSEIEIVNCIKSRQSIEVLYVSSHSCDSTKSSSQHGTSAGRRRSSEGTVYVTDSGSNAGAKKDTDTEAETSDEFFLRLSPSQSQKSVYLTPVCDNNGSFHSTSLKLDPKIHSPCTSSKADVLISESQSDKEVPDATEQNNKHAPGCFNSEKHSVCTVHEEEIQEGDEKPSQRKSSGSCTDTRHTDPSGNVTRQKLSVKDAVSPGGSHCVTESFTAFSKVKDVFQITAVEPSQCVAQVDSERQLRWSKRKRSDGNQNTPVDSSAISDNESDGQVQKKAKMETADITTGHEFTPSSLCQEVLAFQQKGILGLHSTPQTDHVTPAKQPSASSIEQDSVQETDTEWEVILKVKVKQVKQNDKDIYRVQQCEDITEDIARLTARTLGDSTSSGGLADTSSKNTTPSSTASGGCPFPLPPNRLSLISTTSGSSTSSGGSSVVQGVMRQKCTTDGGPFLIPNNPGLKVSKERSFRSEEVLCGIQPGICSPIVEGCEIMYRVISSSHPERSERDQGRSTRTDKGDSGKKSDIQKPNAGSIIRDVRIVITRTDAVSSSPADSDVVLVAADVLKETPKSTVKVLKRRRSRSSVKKHSLPLSSSKQSVVRNRGPLSPVQDKSPITSSVEDVVTLIAESETKDGSDTATKSTLSNPEVSSLLLECSYLKLGTPVFARWTDRKYYSGILQERSKGGRWKVLFDDTSVKLLVEDFVIAVDELPMGQLVYALAESGDYESGVIVNVEKKCNDTMYIVELDDDSYVTVSRSHMCMTEDQAKILREMVATSPTNSLLHRADISLDNVLLGKRNRSSSRDIENKLDCPGVSGMSKASPRKKVASASLTESDTSSSVEDVDGVEPESHEIKLGKVKGLDRRTPRKNLGNLLGPVPPAGSKLFAGKLFLLTSSDVKHLCTKREDAEGYDSECQCTACGVSQNAVFSRSHLTEQIKAGGGKLYDRFEDVPPNTYDSCYLISDRPNQTAKFILCLAHGIQLVSYAWIIECCETNVCQPLSKHYLAAGWSLEKRGYVRRDLSKRPLFCVNIGLISDTKNFRKFWEQVLKGAGAFVFGISQKPCMSELEPLDVMVSSRSCPVDIQKQLEELGTPLVSTAWIVQCLINGSKVPTDNKTAI